MLQKARFTKGCRSWFTFVTGISQTFEQQSEVKKDNWDALFVPRTTIEMFQ